MLATIAELLLSIALILATSQILLPLITSKVQIFKFLALAQFLFVSASFGLLIMCFVTSDFSVALVANNSHISKPMIYKVAGAWGNHEGSMLMWILTLVSFNLFYALFATNSKYHIITLSYQGIIIALFLIYILILSNPFIRNFPSPIIGLGLNPILQDIGLALHPPVLYLGYVGFSIAYASSISALITHTEIKIWARSILPFIMLSWSMLTIGIGLGSWWAYRELGWGGFWFWDPVENASLIPWLSATALLHTLVTTIRTGKLGLWALLLSLLTFSLSGVGTFLVRSGSITSVHSFATDPARGIAILAIITILITLGMIVYLFNSSYYSSSKFGLQGRVLYIALNNVVFIFFTIVIVTGTLYPIVLEVLIGEKISIGAPYYSTFLAPTVISLLILCIIGPRYSYTITKFDLKNLPKITSILSMVTASLILYYLPRFNFISCVIIFLSISLCIDNLAKLYATIRYRNYNIASMLFAHMGFAILALSITINSLTQMEIQKELTLNQNLKIGNYKVILKDLQYYKGPNFYSQTAIFEAWHKNNFLGYVYPEIHFYPVENQKTIETGILTTPLYDIYLTIDKTPDETTIITSFYFRPMISMIWFGCLLLFLGGLLSTVKYFIILYSKIVITSKQSNVS